MQGVLAVYGRGSSGKPLRTIKVRQLFSDNLLDKQEKKNS